LILKYYDIGGLKVLVVSREDKHASLPRSEAELCFATLLA